MRGLPDFSNNQSSVSASLYDYSELFATNLGFNYLTNTGRTVDLKIFDKQIYTNTLLSDDINEKIHYKLNDLYNGYQRNNQFAGLVIDLDGIDVTFHGFDNSFVLTNTSKIGFEIGFYPMYQSVRQMISLNFTGNDNILNLARIEFDFYNKKVLYRDKNNNLVNLINNITLQSNLSVLHKFKMIVNLKNKSYDRIYYNDSIVNMNNIAIYSSVTSLPSFYVQYQVQYTYLTNETKAIIVKYVRLTTDEI